MHALVALWIRRWPSSRLRFPRPLRSRRWLAPAPALAPARCFPFIVGAAGDRCSAVRIQHDAFPDFAAKGTSGGRLRGLERRVNEVIEKELESVQMHLALGNEKAFFEQLEEAWLVRDMRLDWFIGYWDVQGAPVDELRMRAFAYRVGVGQWYRPYPSPKFPPGT
jgi:hypothetical protein